MKKSKRGTVRGGYLPNLQVFYSGGIPNLVKVKPAKVGTQFHRNVKHCKFGDEGECASCANAIAGMDAGIGKLCISNDATFIAVHKWIRSKKMSYGIGTIYRSNQGKFQKKFDSDKEALLASPEAEGTVLLHPYTRHKHASGSGPSGPSGKGGGGPNKTVMRTRTSPKGARRRALRSGLGMFVKPPE